MNRGDVYRIRPRGGGGGHEQRGARFGVIVQTEALARLSTIVVAPTSQSAQAASFRPEIEIGAERTRVLVDQLTAIDATRLGRRVSRLDTEELWAVDDAIRIVLAV